MSLKTVYQNNRVCIPEGTLVVLSGLPGSGKSHLHNHRTAFSSRATWLSSDALRDEITPPQSFLFEGRHRQRRNESVNTEVFAILKLRARAGLRTGRTVVIDATNPTDADRQDWVELADEIGVPHIVLILDTELQTCLDRADARGVWVPESAIRAMHQPPAPELDRATQERVRKQGSKQVVTAPQGFQRTSRFTHHVLKDDDTLEFTWKELPEGAWDVIGDVHGLFDEFLLLLEKAGWQVKDGQLQPHPQGRKLLLVGDLVDRGTKTIELLRFIKKAVEAGLALVLKGNHEAKLVRFMKAAKSEGIERWTSYANAETGMSLLKLEEAERDALTEFMNRLPAYVVDPKSRTVFLHADVHTFEPGLTTTEDMLYGMSGWKKVDSDALYQEGVSRGINQYTLVRGHIPQTSEQAHSFSLERHPFQKGELVLLRFDEVREVFETSTDMRERVDAFNRALVTQRCEFDFTAYSARYDCVKGLDALVESKHVTRQFDESKMFRVFKYSKQTFWNNGWGESPLLLKARGLVMDPGGSIVSHPFDKVFNYLESDTGKDLADDTAVIVVDKLNGFLGITSANPLKRGDLLVHTQGGFGGDFVQYIRDHLEPGLKGQILKFLSKNDVTLMYEVLHKSDPHIIDYPAEMQGLHLIGVRGKNQADLAWREEDVDTAAAQMGLRRPSWARTTFGQARERIRDTKTEGFMVRADNDQQDFLLKMKSPYYLTTKFLGRLSAGRIKHLFSNPKDFKKTVDEEFYVIVDSIVATHTGDTFLALTDGQRVVEVRNLINQMQ